MAQHPDRPLFEQAVLQALLGQPDIQEARAALQRDCSLLLGRPVTLKQYRERYELAGQLLLQGAPAEEVLAALHPPELEPWTWQEVVEMALHRLLPRRLRRYVASKQPLAQVGYLAAASRQAQRARERVLELCARYRHALGDDWGAEALWWALSRGMPMITIKCFYDDAAMWWPLTRGMPIPTPQPLPLAPPPRRGPGSRQARVRKALRALRQRWRAAEERKRARPPREATLLKAAKELVSPALDYVEKLEARWLRRRIAQLRRILGLPRPRPGRPRRSP